MVSFLWCIGTDLFTSLLNSSKHIQIWRPVSSMNSVFTVHEMLIIFAVCVNGPFIPAVFPFHLCVYVFFPQHHFYTDVTRDGPDRRKDPTEEQTHDSPCLVSDSALHTVATNLTGKNWAWGAEHSCNMLKDWMVWVKLYCVGMTPSDKSGQSI